MATTKINQNCAHSWVALSYEFGRYHKSTDQSDKPDMWRVRYQWNSAPLSQAAHMVATSILCPNCGERKALDYDPSYECEEPVTL
jgi:hypothetical protein